MDEAADKPETVRLFVALPVPADFAARACDLPHWGAIGGRWNHAGDLHITLRFLGDLPPESVAAIQNALTHVRRPPFHVEVGGLGVFETPRQAVLYARIDSTRKMNALCGDVSDALTPLGFDFGARPFIPHITLARLNNSRGIHQYIEKYDKFVIGHWQAESFSLMRSGAVNSAGCQYATLARYKLLS